MKITITCFAILGLLFFSCQKEEGFKEPVPDLEELRKSTDVLISKTREIIEADKVFAKRSPFATGHEKGLLSDQSQKEIEQLVTQYARKAKNFPNFNATDMSKGLRLESRSSGTPCTDKLDQDFTAAASKLIECFGRAGIGFSCAGSFLFAAITAEISYAKCMEYNYGEQ